MNVNLLKHLSKLTPFKVSQWEDYTYKMHYQDVASGLHDADVVGSRMQGSSNHSVLLDIDYPAYLVESSTEGHYHLYLEVPGGVEHKIYMKLLKQLGKAGIIEPGYAEASRNRGYSALRLPWVNKNG